MVFVLPRRTCCGRSDLTAPPSTNTPAVTPTRAKIPPKTPPKIFVPVRALESSTSDSAPNPMAPKIPAKIRAPLPAMNAPIRHPKIPPNTNANHHPVPDGQ